MIYIFSHYHYTDIIDNVIIMKLPASLAISFTNMNIGMAQCVKNNFRDPI